MRNQSNSGKAKRYAKYERKTFTIPHGKMTSLASSALSIISIPESHCESREIHNFSTLSEKDFRYFDIATFPEHHIQYTRHMDIEWIIILICEYETVVICTAPNMPFTDCVRWVAYISRNMWVRASRSHQHRTTTTEFSTPFLIHYHKTRGVRFFFSLFNLPFVFHRCHPRKMDNGDIIEIEKWFVIASKNHKKSTNMFHSLSLTLCIECISRSNTENAMFITLKTFKCRIWSATN